MTRSLTRGCIMAGLAALSVSAAPAAAAVAPGRVLFSVATKIPESNVDAGGAGPAVALPDGGTVMLAYDRASRDVTVVRLRTDGALEPSFGRGGIARVAIPATVGGLAQILRQPDGRLIVVGTSPPAKSELPRLVIARLTAGGALDPSFGNGGIVATAVQGSCGGCSPVALAPDGSIVLTGNTGKLSPTLTPTPTAKGSLQWVVARLTPDGAPDAAFGVRAIGAPAINTGGYGTVVRPDGRIVVLGTLDGAMLAGLTATGAPDLAFNAGEPATVPTDGLQLLLRTSGAVDVTGRDRVVRVNGAGKLDASYGAGGSVLFSGFNPSYGPPAMLATPDGGTVLYGQATFEPTPATQPRLHLQRITPSGALGMSAGLNPAFGGGLATGRARTTGSLEQNGFHGELVPRADGSYLAVGGLSVVRYTGEGEGFSAGYVAAAAYSPLFEPDRSFGGTQQPASARVRLPRQRARSAAELRRVLARVTTSGPGLVQLRVRDGRGRVLAQYVAPSYAAGTATIRIPLTETGRRVLHRGHSVRVRVGHDFRDVLTARSRGVVTARLR